MSPQESIAHYKIISKLGEGGMGAVYRATDSKLNRDVAIKVLPDAFRYDSARMARFGREAQVLAALNHPNIAAIYGIEQGAIVMELVEGGELQGPVAVDVAIGYAKQIAAALEAAHEKGIVHRDLKPANIKITPEGVVKVLDFGLAKAAAEEGGAPGSVSPTISPTISLAMTQAGVILGTAAYMSPEQVRGKVVDKRADIWAFGVVLYEMLTGKLLFGGGETVSDSMAAVITKEPDWSALPPETPGHVRRLLKLCLRKDPRMRLRDIGDARVLLEEPEAEEAQPAAAKRRWLAWVLAAAGLAIVAAVGGIGWMRTGAGESGPGTAQFTLPLPEGTTWPIASSATQWVPSPDGRNLAMILAEGGGTSIWVRPLGAMAAHKLDKTTGANYPFWAPDGQSIAFFSESALRRVPLAGGAAVKICDLPPEANNASSSGDGGTWSRDGTIVFAVSQGPLLRVAAGGGIAAPATKLEKDENAHHWPQFLPDGRHVLFEVRAKQKVGGIYVQELGSAKRVRVMESSMRAVWSPPGYLLFSRESNLFAQRMNARTFQLEGEARLVAEDVQANEGNGRSSFAVSENGVLVYRQGTAASKRQITWRGRDGKVLGQIGTPARLNGLRLSPDEKSAAMIITNGGGGDVWVMDLATGVMTPMTRDGGSSQRSTEAWAPDSKRLAVMTPGGGVAEVIVASGQSTEMTKDSLFPEDYLPDESSILCQNDSATRFNLLSLGEGHAVRPVVTTPYRQGGPRLSPDGRYVAYLSSEIGGNEVYVAAFPSFSVKRRVSTNGGTFPVWTKRGKAIAYSANDGTVMEVEVRTTPELELGERKPLFKVAQALNRFGVTADGERFLTAEPMAQKGAAAMDLTVVLGWWGAMPR